MKRSIVRRLSSVVVIFLLLAPTPALPAHAQAPFDTDFSAWDLPLPAGQWTISRGPCQAVGEFDHQCGYYEDECALDITSSYGSMEHVPVLAPQDGQVFFIGTRADSGLALLLQHGDGRVSALMHLSKIVVAPEQRVVQGQVVAYAGNTGSSSRAHVHFHVQPNTVERSCLPLDTLDEINLAKSSAVSHNLGWSSLTLVDPPASLPLWLPLAQASGPGQVVPARLQLPPVGRVDLPVVIPTTTVAAFDVYYASRKLAPASQTADHSVFLVPLAAPVAPGEYERLVQLRPITDGGVRQTLRLRLSVRAPAATEAGRDIIYISPAFVSPANYSEHRTPPRLCWSEPAAAGLAPLRFRAMVAGPQPADSGWTTADCWQTPPLPPGTYFWKVFVRDGNGFMNRTNQRPFVFKLR